MKKIAIAFFAAACILCVLGWKFSGDVFSWIGYLLFIEGIIFMFCRKSIFKASLVCVISYILILLNYIILGGFLYGMIIASVIVLIYVVNLLMSKRYR